MPVDESVSREIMGNVPMWLAVAFYMAALVACGWALLALMRRIRQHRLGRRVAHSESSSWSGSVVAVLRYLTFHHQLLRDRFAGVAHILLFYGFFVLFIGTCLVFLEHDTPLHFFYGRFYLVASLVIDLGGLAFLAGLSMFLYRRLFGNSQRILRRAYVAALLWLLLAIGLTGFVLEGARIAVDRPDFERWSVAGYAIGLGLNVIGIEGDAALRLHRFSWTVHAILCVAFFGLVPWRFFHTWCTARSVGRCALGGLAQCCDRSTCGLRRWRSKCRVRRPGRSCHGSICFRPMRVLLADGVTKFVRPTPRASRCIRAMSCSVSARPWICQRPMISSR